MVLSFRAFIPVPNIHGTNRAEAPALGSPKTCCFMLFPSDYDANAILTLLFLRPNQRSGLAVPFDTRRWPVVVRHVCNSTQRHQRLAVSPVPVPLATTQRRVAGRATSNELREDMEQPATTGGLGRRWG